MELLVIASTVMSFLFVVLLFGRAGRKADNKRKRLDSIREVQRNVSFDEFNESFYKRFISPRMQSLSKALARLMPRQDDQTIKNEAVEKQLRQAGLYIPASEYLLLRRAVMVLITSTFFCIGLLLHANQFARFLIILFGSVLAVLVPNYFIKARISSRQGKIRNQIPEVLDLLSVCVEAGLSFDNSLIKIAEKLQGPFVDELLIVHREIQMGRPRRDALKNLGECSSISELKTFSSSMAQADQLGIPINNVLKVQASQLRLTRKQQAQEKGMKAPVKMMLPMVAFVFPVIFIILLGPTIIQLISEFGK